MWLKWLNICKGIHTRYSIAPGTRVQEEEVKGEERKEKRRGEYKRGERGEVRPGQEEVPTPSKHPTPPPLTTEREQDPPVSPRPHRRRK